MSSGRHALPRCDHRGPYRRSTNGIALIMMRITRIRDAVVPISRYSDPAIPSGGLTTSVVAIETDVVVGGQIVVGYGFSSIGRFGQHGLIWDRFAPRLLEAEPQDLLDDAGSNIDPLRAWTVMMRGEKAGGHGDRSVAVGTLDMALWDAAAKIAQAPLYRILRERLGMAAQSDDPVNVYASGGYLYPRDDLSRLRAEVEHMRDIGYKRVKIKIGSAPIEQDIQRIETVLSIFRGAVVAVDAMNAYSPRASVQAALQLASYGLCWFEDICDPLDFKTHATVAARYPYPIAAGEALFSPQEAALLADYAGLRPQQDILLFDPAHCYGIRGFACIVQTMCAAGWPLSAFWPHGGHLFTLHVVAAMGLGGSELNPLSFFPFGGQEDGARLVDGRAPLPTLPGIGFEGKAALHRVFMNAR